MKMTKKYIFLFGVVIFFLIYILNKILTSPERQVLFDFNYLNNDKVVNNSNTLLLNNDIPERNVDLWMKYVKRYNTENKAFIKDTSNGWKTIYLNKYNRINFNSILDKWYEEKDSFDLNCRQSSFILIKDMVSGECVIEERDSDIEQEINKLKSISDEKITNKDSRTYIYLFTHIKLKIGNSKDIDVYDETLSALKDYWNKGNLKFKDGKKSKLIQVVLIEPNASDIKATIAHTGLSIKDGDMIYFIEKKNPCFPYQISRFKNYDDLNRYIITQFKSSKDYKLMILENNNVIYKNDN